MLCTFLDPTVLGETAQVGLSRHGAQMVLFSRHGICFILNIERVLKELDSSPFMYAVFAAGKITSVGLKSHTSESFLQLACGRPLTLIARSMDTRFLQAFVDLISVQLAGCCWN